MSANTTPTQDRRLSAASSSRRWQTPLVGLIVGLLVGAGGGVGIGLVVADPTATEQYQSLNDRAAGLEADLIAAQGRTADAVADARRAATELATREAAVAAREQAVTAIEQQIAATSIGTGIWTVGVDVEPGTYRTAEALTGYCYWAIYRSGSNGSDIIDNDGPEGGFPTVTLSVGQDFENSDCGTFVKQ